jgi:hypothetical protein
MPTSAAVTVMFGYRSDSVPICTSREMEKARIFDPGRTDILMASRADRRADFTSKHGRNGLTKIL